MILFFILFYFGLRKNKKRKKSVIYFFFPKKKFTNKLSRLSHVLSILVQKILEVSKFQIVYVLISIKIKKVHVNDLIVLNKN